MNILFAKASEKKYRQMPDETAKDLAIDEIISRISVGVYDKAILRSILVQLPKDPDDIRFRQEIFSDFDRNTGLRESLEEALPMIRTMRDFAGARRAVRDKDNSLYTLLSDLRSLATYVDTTRYLSKQLARFDLSSRALTKLRDELSAITETEEFTDAEKDIKVMLEDLSTVRSAMIGINFNPDLSISEVAAIEFLPYPLRSKYKFVQMAAIFGPIIQAGQGAQALTRTLGNAPKSDDPLLAAIAPKLEKHLKKHFSDIKQVLSKYTRLDGHFITEMYEGLTFYIALSRFAASLKGTGYELCMPEISDASEKYFEVKDFYNVRLAVLGKKDIVKNDFRFSEDERLFILTGPNRGGKTILEQGLGLISVFASLGFFVTASSCRGIPFQNILTHFPIDENLTINYGRLGEEAVRVRNIVKEADARTLILFNETYSTTSEADALYLSEDLLHILKDKGSAVIFNTHIHELARRTDKMNEWEGSGSIVSLVMEIRDNVNTFKVKRSPPDTCSYARNIALKYGITYDQMKEEKN
ncbi:MAG: hypothetical protein J5750_02045 [Clostridiales bacterium]|nr:hypothetical protein [Clostridiales bacterium]